MVHVSVSLGTCTCQVRIIVTAPQGRWKDSGVQHSAHSERELSFKRLSKIDRHTDRLVAAIWYDDRCDGGGRGPRRLLTWLLEEHSPGSLLSLFSGRLTSLMPQRWIISQRPQPLPTRQSQQSNPANRERSFHLVWYVTNGQGHQLCVSMRDRRLDPVSCCTPSCGCVSVVEDYILKSMSCLPAELASVGS